MESPTVKVCPEIVLHGLKTGFSTPAPASRSKMLDALMVKETLPPQDEATDLPLRRQLAQLKGVPLTNIGRIRTTPDRLPALIDVSAILMDKKKCHASRDVRNTLVAHSDLIQKVDQFNFGGRGRYHSSLVPKDLATLIEIIFLLPGRAAAQVRRSAAEIFVRYYGGDLALIGEVEQNHHVQQVLQSTDASHPLRAFGEVVETQSPAGILRRIVQRSNALALRRVWKFHLKTRKEV